MAVVPASWSTRLRAIELAGITVSGDTRCGVFSGTGDDTHVLWETIRIGLWAAELSDSRILLSVEFEETHCFQIAGRDPADVSQVGLAFEPVRDRGVSDIAGTLWVDVATGELQSVEFHYVDEGGAPFAEGAGGRIEFAVLPQGPWVVERWELRLPIGEVDGMTLFQERLGIVLEVLPGGGE